MRDMNQFGDIIRDMLNSGELEAAHEQGQDTVYLITNRGTVDIYFKNSDIADKFWMRWLECTTVNDQSYFLCKAIFAENINICRHFASRIIDANSEVACCG